MSDPETVTQIIPEDGGYLHYGVQVACLDDGGYAANGHVEPRRFLAAANKHARADLGLLNAEDEYSARATEWLADVRHDYALPKRNEDGEWGFKVVPADTPRALPVTWVDR